MTNKENEDLKKLISELNPYIDNIELISSKLEHETDQKDLGKQLYNVDQKLNQQVHQIFKHLEEEDTEKATK